MMLNLILNRAPWQDKAICAQVGDEFWFPEKGGSTKPAKQICAGCPVSTECLQYALDNDERFGVWGGYSERERRAIKRGLVIVPKVSARIYKRKSYQHGELGRYKQGCTCTPCRAAMAEYRAERRGLQGKPPVVCQTCGSEFDGHGLSKYCSNICRRAKRKSPELGLPAKRVERDCLQCGAPFLAHPRSKYCSNNCKQKAFQARHREQVSA